MESVSDGKSERIDGCLKNQIKTDVQDVLEVHAPLLTPVVLRRGCNLTTANITYPWYSVSQPFRNGILSHNGNCKTFDDGKSERIDGCLKNQIKTTKSKMGMHAFSSCLYLNISSVSNVLVCQRSNRAKWF
jgi:hypothetical protein